MIRRILDTIRIVILLVLAITVLFCFSPSLINKLLPPLLEQRNLQDVSIRISRLTPYHLNGSVTLQQTTKRPAVTGEFQVDFSPGTLLRGEIEAVTVENGVIQLIAAGGKLGLRDFSLPSPSPGSSPERATIPLLPVALQTINFRNIRIELVQPGRQQMSITVEGKLVPQFTKNKTGGYALAAMEAKITSEGDVPSELQGALKLSGEESRLSLQGRIPALTDIASLLPLPPDIRLQCTMDFDGELLLNNALHTVDQLRARLSFPELVVQRGPVVLTSNEQTPLTFSTQGTAEAFDFTLDNLTLTSPIPVQTRISGTFTPADRTLQGSATVGSALLEQDAAINFFGVFGSDHSELDLTLTGEKQQSTTQPTIVLGPHQLNAKLALTGGHPVISSTIGLASVHLPDQDLALEDIAGKLNYTPGNTTSQEHSSGTLTIDSIRYKRQSIAALAATFSPTVSGINYSGELKGRLPGKLRVKFSGTSDAAAPLILSFTVPAAQVTNASMPNFISLPKGLAFSGRLKGQGDLRYTSGKLEGKGGFSISQGIIDLKEQKIHAEGIATDISLPALPQPTSRPSQQLRIAAMDIGSLKFSDGRIFFRIENQESFFIEKSRFNWCGGKVESGSLRISLVDPELSTTLYCDRLQFTELLGQLGISDAEGSGSLNGRLPLFYNGKEMVFDDGFLFSTPGDSGIVRFNNTAMLRQGLPEMDQAAYLDYSMKAMENFAYNWTKLTFNSKGNDLLISMQIDGKPASPLPYGYRNGQLVPTAEGGGIQYPIRLDVNFHLPFGEIFKYGQRFQKAMKQ